MTHIAFLSWLKGLLEISNTQVLGEKEVEIIKEHLNLAFAEKPELDYYLQGFFETFAPDHLGNGELGRIKAAVQGRFLKVTGKEVKVETSGLNQVEFSEPFTNTYCGYTPSKFGPLYSGLVAPRENPLNKGEDVVLC